MNQKKIIIFFISLIVLIGLGFSGWYYRGHLSCLFEKTVSPQEAGEKAIAYINEVFLTGQEGIELIPPVIEESGLYQINTKFQGQEFKFYVSKDGHYLFLNPPLNLDQKEPVSVPSSEEEKEEKTTIGSFVVHENEVCKEGDKPIVYFFGSEGCPHCRWEHPIIDEVAQDFKDYISYRSYMDSQEERDVFEQYSTGGIPTIVIGCKYSRVGSGEHIGEEQERKVLAALICDLLKEPRPSICEEVKELINQI